MATGARDHPTRPTSGTDQQTEARDRRGVLVVVAPVVALLEHDRGVRSQLAGRHGHDLGCTDDVGRGDAGDLRCCIDGVVIVGEQERLIFVEAHAEQLPTKLCLLVDLRPSRRSGVDELRVLPALLKDVPGDGVLQHGIRAGNQL